MGETPIKAEDSTKTRTSYNSWVPRDKSPIIDTIYRRAAELMRIDEAMFRRRDKEEIPDNDNLSSLSEDLQLVNYKETQGKRSRLLEQMDAGICFCVLAYSKQKSVLYDPGNSEYTRYVSARVGTLSNKFVRYSQATFSHFTLSHHDFGYARIDEKKQGARFATLLVRVVVVSPCRVNLISHAHQSAWSFSSAISQQWHERR